MKCERYVENVLRWSKKKTHSHQCGVNTLLLTHEACKKNGKSAVQSEHRHTRTRWKQKKRTTTLNERQRTPTDGIGVRSGGGQESDRRWWFLSLPLFLIFNAHNMSVGFRLAFFLIPPLLANWTVSLYFVRRARYGLQSKMIRMQAPIPMNGNAST